VVEDPLLEIDGHRLRPYILCYPQVAEGLIEACPLPDPLVVDVFKAESQPFYRLVNAGNRLAFGGLGMPPWVQLDCCTLPSAMIGFAVERTDIEGTMWQSLVDSVREGFGTGASREVAEHQGWVPVSEYCALPSAQAGTCIGFSHYALLKGLGLGLRTKALAMACYGAKVQIGLTQYGNSAVRTHTALGPLELLEPRARPHDRSEDTFVYRLQLPGRAQLVSLVKEGAPAPESAEARDDDVEVRSGHTGASMAKLLAAHGSVRIVRPGLIDDGTRKVLRVECG
jgi:hypothetical protein